MHEVLVTNEGEAVRGCPNYVRSMPNSKKDYEGIEPCAVGSTVEVRTLFSLENRCSGRIPWKTVIS